MEPAPLPPHERTWRHPSEIGPSRVQIETTSQGRPMLLATGALAAVMLVVMVVAMTPRPADGPEAISATTKPALVEATSSRSATVEPAALSANRPSRLASFAPIPNAVAATPVQRAIVVARTLPDAAEAVHVKTEQVTYRVEWSDIALLGLDQRAVVFNDRGELVARLVDGNIVVLVD